MTNWAVPCCVYFSKSSSRIPRASGAYYRKTSHLREDLSWAQIWRRSIIGKDLILPMRKPHRKQTPKFQKFLCHRVRF